MADVLILKQRPMTVEAMVVPEQSIPGLFDAARWCNGVASNRGVAFVDDRGVRQTAKPGDYIIRSSGGFYPAPADVVAAKYEPVL